MFNVDHSLGSQVKKSAGMGWIVAGTSTYLGRNKRQAFIDYAFSILSHTPKGHDLQSCDEDVFPIV
jgi:hypothetical protein